MGGLKNKKFADIVENLFGMARLRMYVQIIAEKKQLQIRRYEVDIRRGCNCDLQKLLNERKLYREEQKKSNQRSLLVTLS